VEDQPRIPGPGEPIDEPAPATPGAPVVARSKPKKPTSKTVIEWVVLIASALIIGLDVMASLSQP
jgi:hypothetical protein